jgi:dTDP-4-dehydrorhamnose 3,5-epimerase-like enzyme
MRFCLLIVLNCLFCIACSNLRTEKKHNPLTGKWNIKAIKTKDTILLPPGLTTYNFGMDSTYTVALHKTEEIIYIYGGIYQLNSEKNILKTDYNMEGPQHDEAKIILLNKDETHIVDFKTKDTLLFGACRK